MGRVGRVLAAEVGEAILGLIITSLVSPLGDTATLSGITGTGLLMGATALILETGAVIVAALAFAFPFASTTALETSLNKPLTAVTNGQLDRDGSTTIQSLYDK